MWTNIWNSIKTFFTDNIYNIILFVVVLILGVIIIKLLSKLLKRVFAKSKIDKTVQTFLIQVIRFVLYMVYFITLFSIIGIPITSLVAIFTALSVAIGLSIQASLSNLANGMVILASKPFKVGDTVEIDGTKGTVTEVRMVNTTLRTPTNEIIIIPHNTTISAIIKNYSETEKRRIDITVSVDYSSDIEEVKRIIQNVLDNYDGVEKEDGTVVRLDKCSASSYDFAVKFWVKNEIYWDAYYDANELIVKALNENNITIPYQIIDVNIKNDEKNKTT